MKTFSMRRRFLLPIAAGLAAAQVIGYVFVRQANLEMAARVEGLGSAGWVAIPAGPAAQSLKSFGAAFGGGLFFTLSLGAGLSLATVMLLFLWRRFCGGHRRALAIIALLWAGAMGAVNLQGPVLFPSLFVIFIPLATALAAFQLQSSPVPAPHPKRRWYLPLIVLLLLTALWTSQLNRGLFTAIRDHLLLNNAIGQRVNDFYYRYTLFAAEAFKTLEQKTLRTCHLDPALHQDAAVNWSALLARYDVLAVPPTVPADVTVDLHDGKLRLTAWNGARVAADPSEFRQNAPLWLARLSGAADRYAPFRHMVLLGLLVGFPVLLYVAVDGAIGRAAGLVVPNEAVVWFRAAICMAIGVALLMPLLLGRGGDLSTDRLAEALRADAWPRRVAALRWIESHRLEISAYPQYGRLLDSPLVVERYALARALGASRHPATYGDLLRLMKDPHPNVVCQAYYALGERGRRGAVKAIASQMVQSDHWYTQWYGYRAMRRLGWHQTRSTSDR